MWHLTSCFYELLLLITVISPWVNTRPIINAATFLLCCFYTHTHAHPICVPVGQRLSSVWHPWPLKMVERDILLDGQTIFNLLSGYMEFHSTPWCHVFLQIPGRSCSMCFQKYVWQPPAWVFWPLHLLKAAESPVGFSTRKNHFENTSVSVSGREQIRGLNW